MAKLLGMTTFWRCNKSGAIPHFNEHLRDNPGDFSCLLFRGISHNIVGQKQNALRDYQQAVQVGNESEKLVAKSFLQENSEDSVRMLKEATRKYPTDATGWFWYGLSKRIPLDEKVTALEQCIKLNYEYAHECFFELGIIHAEQGKHEEAIKNFEASLVRNHDRTACHIQLGYSLLKIDQVSEAKQHLETALTLNPALTDANYYLSEIYKKQGNLQEAQRHFDIWFKSRYEQTVSGPPPSNQTSTTDPSAASLHVSADQVDISLNQGLNAEPQTPDNTTHTTQMEKEAAQMQGDVLQETFN